MRDRFGIAISIVDMVNSLAAIRFEITKGNNGLFFPAEDALGRRPLQGVSQWKRPLPFS